MITRQLAVWLTPQAEAALAAVPGDLDGPKMLTALALYARLYDLVSRHGDEIQAVSPDGTITPIEIP